IRSISRIRLINREGVIKASSEKGEMEKRLSADDAGCRECHKKDIRGLFLKSAGLFRWVQPVTNKPECHQCHDPSIRISGVFIIDFSLADLSSHVLKHMYRGILILLVSLICISVALFFVSKTVVIRRLNSVIERIRKFKGGDYNGHMTPEGHDEITKLEENFNEMAEAINERERERDILHKQVSRSYEQWQHTFDSITELILIVDMEGNIVRANRTFMEYLGVSQEDLREKKCFGIFGGEGVQGKNVPARTSDIHYNEEVIVDRDGRTFSISTFPYTYPEADFHGAILVARDITERKELEWEREKLIIELQDTLDKVSRSQKMWQDTFDSIGDLISIHDGDFNIVKVNRAFAEYFGLEPRAVINRKCYEFFHSGTSPVISCPHLMTLNEMRPASGELIDARTKRILRISTYPFTIPRHLGGAETQGSIHVVKDITDEREREMRLIMSERLAALGQMASGVAHEINNPLAAILGCAEGLLSRVRKGQFSPELFENYLKIIEEEISRCKNITMGMLSQVRETKYEKKGININEALDRILEIIGFQGRLKKVELLRNYVREIPVIYGNEGELKQTFMAIISNALDAMGEEGAITLETGVEGEAVFAAISDSGPGIPADVVDRIFDPFFTTKSETGGTGLGLSIAGKIINNHKGRIEVSTEKGKGTTFKIILPLK
ncbi:MAG TPA: ATP-binding protein, partial [Thermodesulfovibrionales bacterium]|nr:ATP-binding protein [Thermodesulfovibrionales bacterium]